MNNSKFITSEADSKHLLIATKIINKFYPSFSYEEIKYEGHHFILKFSVGLKNYILKYDNKSITKKNINNEVFFYQNANSLGIHKAIPRLLNFGTFQTYSFIILEYIDGINLSELSTFSLKNVYQLINVMNNLHFSTIVRDQAFISNHISKVMKRTIKKIRELDDLAYLEDSFSLYFTKYINLFHKEKLCLVHGDFISRNIIFSVLHEQNYLIDFEWSKIDFIYIDICRWILEIHKNKSSFQINFLYHYLNNLSESENIITYLNFCAFTLTIERIHNHHLSLDKKWLTQQDFFNFIDLFNILINGGNLFEWAFNHKVTKLEDFFGYCRSNYVIIDK
jgi:thiamine kinase-like enzyme